MAYQNSEVLTVSAAQAREFYPVLPADRAPGPDPHTAHNAVFETQ